MKRILSLIALIGLALLFGTCGMASAQNTEEKKLTLMVYLTGSDLETKAGAASEDLMEMIDYFPSSRDINVIVMASGSKEWSFSVSADETAIYALRPGGMKKVYADGLMNMGEAGTLKMLLDYGFNNYSAEQYALILWDHGAGPMMGVCFDELFTGEDGMDSLSLAELDEALSQSPFAHEKLSFIGFDACLMATMETALTVAPYAEYMIASQDTEPAQGWSYSFLTDLADDVSGAQTGKRIIDAYLDSVGDTLATITLSLVDLSLMEDAAQHMSALFDALHEDLTPQSYQTFASCRVSTKSAASGTPYPYDLIDLIDLLEIYEAQDVADCGELLSQLRQAIVYNRSSTGLLNGLSVYYPHYNKELFISPLAKDYVQMDYSSGYSDFLRDMSSIWLGKSLTDWDTELPVKSAAVQEETIIALQLTPQQAEHFASAELLIFERVQGNNYHLTYRSSDVSLEPDGLLQAVYRGEALYIVNEEGTPITRSVGYHILDDTYGVAAMLFKEYFYSSDDILGVLLLYKPDASGKLTLTEVVQMDSNPLGSGKSTIDLSQWHEIHFINFGYIPAYDENGALLPLSQWASDGATGSLLTLDTLAWYPEFINLRDPDDRYAVFKITDIQNNSVYSEFVPIANPYAKSIGIPQQTLVDNEYCRITILDAELITGMEPLFRLTLQCENRYSGELTVTATHRAIDNRIIDLSPSSQYVSAGETSQIEIDFSAELLRQARVQRGAQLNMTLEVAENFFDTLFSLPLVIEHPLDFSSLYTPEEGKINVLASAQWNTLTFDLFDLYVDEEDNLCASVHITNTGEELVPINVGYAYVNRIQVNGELDSSHSLYDLPAGHDVFTQMKISTHDNMPYDRLLLEGDLLSVHGVESISEIAFDLSTDLFSEDSRVRFTLAEPFAYAQQRSKPVEPVSWPVIYDRNGVTISLMDTRTNLTSSYSTDRSFYFCVSNDTPHEITLDTPYDGTTLDGQEGCFAMLWESIPAKTTLYVEMSVTVGEEKAPASFDTMQTFIRIQDDAGRRDQVHLTVEAAGEPQITGYDDLFEYVEFSCYPASQLHVTAELLP